MKKLEEFLSKLPQKDQKSIKDLLKDKQKLLTILSKPINTLASVQKTKEIKEIPENGIIITEKGKYKLVNDLKWSGKDGIPAISIQGEDITLDFNSHKLLCKNGKTKNHYGIHIYGSKNVVVKNGGIINMGINGIIADTSKNIIISEMNISKLSNADLTLNPSGILSVGCENISIQNSIIGPIDSIGVNLSGIQINLTKNSEINNCKVLDIHNNDGVSTGIGHFLSKGIKVYDTEIKGLETTFNGHNFGGHTCIGFFEFLSEKLDIQRCVVTDVTGSCDDAHGMSMFLCKGVEIDDCYVYNVSSGLKYGKCAKATGIEIYGSNIKVKNSKVKKIYTFNPENKQCTGFSSAQGKNITFSGCISEDVRVFNQKGEESSEFGFGYGFGWAPDPREMFVKPAYKVLYNRCKSISCQVGFDSFFHINSTWDGIISEKNDIPVMNMKDNIRIISCDPCSECPNPISNPIKNVSKANKFKKLKIIL